MPDRRRPHRKIATPTQTYMPYDGTISSLTASAQVLTYDNTKNLVIPPMEWQREAWAMYHTIGECHYGIGDWLSNAMSRVRLIAAVVRPGEDPSPVTDGPVADLVSALAGGIGGQAAMLKRMTVQYSVVGDSYLVGEDEAGDGVLEDMTWKVYSSDEIRMTSRRETSSSLLGNDTPGITYDVMTQRNEWRRLAPESMVCRIWNPDEQFGWASTSAVQAALPILREIDFYNRYIISVLLSRLAMNGLLIIPQEVTFPVNQQFKDQPDPFVAELLDIAIKSIKNPGSASAAIPMPIRVPAQYVEQIKHLTFDTKMGDKIIEDRERAIKRLATALNLPAEALMGMGDLNHWGQWQMEESAIKIHISPVAEAFCMGLNTGYLYPMLKAMKQPTRDSQGGIYTLWYDTDALDQQPDRAPIAKDLHDRGAISDAALRRESGFEEADAPSPKEVKDQVLLKIALGAGASAMTALAKLTGDESLDEPVVHATEQLGPDGEPAPAQPPQAPSGEQTPPAQQNNAPPAKAPPATRPDLPVKPNAELEQIGV